MSQRPAIVLVFLTGLVAVIAAILYSQGSADLSAQDRQPVDFSHELHAGQLGVNCLFCHRHATDSKTATVPSVSLCMSCHRSLNSKTAKAEKLLAYWNERKPIPWMRLQRIPDFVYFTHEMHMKGGLQCADCHGQVDRIRETPRAATYEMGWCLACHRERRASVDCWTCQK